MTDIALDEKSQSQAKPSTTTSTSKTRAPVSWASDDGG